jgi:hypothetical protein
MCEENNYLLFMGAYYYPDGGWNDYVGSYPDLVSAKDKVIFDRSIVNWYQIVDIRTRLVVEKGNV